MKTVALIDYGSGNLHSAERALREAARIANRTREIRVTSDPSALATADQIVLPGVGHFADCMANLKAQTGMIEALEANVIQEKKPFLGICVGMQMMADLGMEDGETEGLGWIGGRVSKIDPGPGHRIPHMGWNALEMRTDHPVLAELGGDPHAYFVHSYAFTADDDAHVAAVTDYGVPIVAAIAKDNLFGTQFHPEKSQKAGLQMLANWLVWTP